MATGRELIENFLSLVANDEEAFQLQNLLRGVPSIGELKETATSSRLQETNFLCARCNSSFSSLDKLKQHAKADHPISCSECDKFKFIVESVGGRYYRCSGKCKNDYKDAS